MNNSFNNPNILLALSRYDHRTHRGVAKFAAQNGWHLNCEMAITGRIPINWIGDGIVTMLGENDDLVRMVINSGCPFVDLSILRDDIPAPRITADNHAIGLTAAEYFTQRGFVNFGFFSSTNDKVAKARRNGFYQRIQDKCTHFTELLSDLNELTPNAELISSWLKTLSFPCAVFTTRDLDASILLDVCLRNNIAVPEQVAILGVDNNELIIESLQVPLSSVNHNVERLGFEGAQLLAKIMNNQPIEHTTIMIPPNGVTSRRSTDYLAVNNDLVRKALARITSLCHNTLFSIDQLAFDLGVSRRYLDKLFKQELGHSCRTELQSTRLSRAKKHLISGVLSMEDIAEQCGFNTPQYFNLCLKQSTGMTPLAFRKYHNAN
jgi:LacI family transcriptional regulator